MDTIYYSDVYPANDKACWLGEAIDDGEVRADDRILNSEGQLYYCDAQGDNAYSGDPEVITSSVCDTTGEHFCNVSGTWEPNSAEDRTHLSENPINSNDQACCRPWDCWAGGDYAPNYPQSYGCVANQSQDPDQPPIEGMRCIDGTWATPVEKYSPYLDFGYCSSENQCLFNYVAEGDKFCVEDGFYYKDDYCENGNWTTRTKLLAQELATIAGGQVSEFTLVCGNTFELLNYLLHTTQRSEGETIHELFGCEGVPDPCNYPVTYPSKVCFNKPDYGEDDYCENVNNFCVLEFTGGLIIGTSVNDVAENLGKVLASLNFDPNACNDKGASGFQNCEGNKIFYNDLTGSVLFYRQGGSFIFGGDTLIWLVDKIKGIITWIQGKTTYDDYLKYGDYYELTYFPNKLDKLYIKQEAGTGIYGVLETAGIKLSSSPYFRRRPFFSIKYQGFNKDVCASVGVYDNRTINLYDPNADRLICRKISDTEYEVLGGSHISIARPDEPTTHPQEWKVMDVWHDLTMKLE
jgi:hypothetical protein